MKKFKIQIATPEELFYDGEADTLIIRTTEGDVAILYNHEPLVSAIAIGEMVIKNGDVKKVAAVSEGFITVDEEKTIVIVDTAEWAENIDKNRAENSKKRAEERLKEEKTDIDKLRAKLALKKAVNRLRVYSKIN